MLPVLPDGLKAYDTLVWLPERGIGFHTTPPMTYGGDYFRKYLDYDATELGENLTRARIAMVREHWAGQIVDIGIGAGLFVRRADCLGYDVNDEAVAWLRKTGRYVNPYVQEVEAITCWDSLEHIAEPSKLLDQVTRWLFVSLPIFESAEQCLESKHYRPGEHLWYWTQPGMILWCERLGFQLEAHDMRETELGREEIHSFAFRRAK